MHGGTSWVRSMSIKTSTLKNCLLERYDLHSFSYCFQEHVVNANKDGFINRVLQNATVRYFAATNAKCLVQRIAPRVVKSAKTDVRIASAKTHVESSVRNATSRASGSADIMHAKNCVGKCVIGLAVTSGV